MLIVYYCLCWPDGMNMQIIVTRSISGPAWDPGIGSFDIIIATDKRLAGVNYKLQRPVELRPL